MDKIELLKNLEKEVKGIPENERLKLFSRLYVSIITSLIKRLVRYEGYSVTNTILKREINNIGHKNAKEIIELFGLSEKSKDSVSKILKIAALILGFQLEVREGETYVKNCPFAAIAKEENEPVICEICSTYCSGVAEEVLGPQYNLQGFHDITKDVPECFFKLAKK